MPPAVLCCGNVVADILVHPVSEPGWGKTTWVDAIELNLGGNGANTSYALARLGIPVRLLSAVGQDDFGAQVLHKLAEANVDTTAVVRATDAPTPCSVVLVHPDGKRALLHRPGASRQAFPSGIHLDPALAAGCSRLHLANIFSLYRFQSHAPRLLVQARELGLATSMDTGWDPQSLWLRTIGPCLPLLDLLFVNEDEAFQLTGSHDPAEAARVLRGRGATSVVVKRGSAGCYVANESEAFVEPAFPVEARDTTGAGDCFAGGFLAALESGQTLREAARFANAVGALNVQQLGAVNGVLNFEQTKAWIKNQKGLQP